MKIELNNCGLKFIAPRTIKELNANDFFIGRSMPSDGSTDDSPVPNSAYTKNWWDFPKDLKVEFPETDMAAGCRVRLLIKDAEGILYAQNITAQYSRFPFISWKEGMKARLMVYDTNGTILDESSVNTMLSKLKFSTYKENIGDMSILSGMLLSSSGASQSASQSSVLSFIKFKGTVQLKDKTTYKLGFRDYKNPCEISSTNFVSGSGKSPASADAVLVGENWSAIVFQKVDTSSPAPTLDEAIQNLTLIPDV